ncbi:MAG: COG1361 S-layer family protein [Halobacteria archaeon]
MRRVFLALILAILIVPGTATAATVAGGPDIGVTASDNRLEPGAEVDLEVSLVNDGKIRIGGPSEYENRIKTARSTTLTLRSGGSPVKIDSGTVAAGSVGEGTSGPFSFTVIVPENADPGRYKLPVDISYGGTSVVTYSDSGSKPQYHDFKRKVTRHVEVVIKDQPRFDVTKSSTNLQVGGNGNYTLKLENVGSDTAYDSTVNVDIQGDQVEFADGSKSAESFVGKWKPGRSKKVVYEVSSFDKANVRNYTVKVDVDYEDEDGVTRKSETMTSAIRPVKEQNFEVTDLNSSLRVGEDGFLEGKLVNEGPRTARNPVVSVTSNSSNVVFDENQYALGTLKPGEDAGFRFEPTVKEDAEARSHQFNFKVRYRDYLDYNRVSDTVEKKVNVEKNRDIFSVELLNSTVQRGNSHLIEIRVTNNLDYTVSEVEAKLFTSSPLSSGDDEAYVSEMGPGESEIIKLDISAASGAVPKTYPASIDFQYRDNDNQTKLSDTYQIPVNVTESESSGGRTVPVVVAVAAVVVAGVWWWRR